MTEPYEATANNDAGISAVSRLRDEKRRLEDAYAHLRNAVGLACGARITEQDCKLWDAAKHADAIAAGQEGGRDV